MAVSHLQCKECKAQYPLEALYVCETCFGPLEVAYDHSRTSDESSELRRRIQGGPQNIWRYADFLPRLRPGAPGGPTGPSAGGGSTRLSLPAGCTPLIRADRLAERLGLREVWVKNDAANPTHSFKDRVVSVAVDEARELGFDTDRLRLHGQPRQLRRRARRRAPGSSPTCSSRLTSRSEGARDRRLRRQRWSA